MATIIPANAANPRHWGLLFCTRRKYYQKATFKGDLSHKKQIIPFYGNLLILTLQSKLLNKK